MDTRAFLQLPVDIINHICRISGAQDAVSLAATCKPLRTTVLCNEKLWQSILSDRYYTKNLSTCFYEWVRTNRAKRLWEHRPLHLQPEPHLWIDVYALLLKFHEPVFRSVQVDEEDPVSESHNALRCIALELAKQYPLLHPSFYSKNGKFKELYVTASWTTRDSAGALPPPRYLPMRKPGFERFFTRDNYFDGSNRVSLSFYYGFPGFSSPAVNVCLSEDCPIESEERRIFVTLTYDNVRQYGTALAFRCDPKLLVLSWKGSAKAILDASAPLLDQFCEIVEKGTLHLSDSGFGHQWIITYHTLIKTVAWLPSVQQAARVELANVFDQATEGEIAALDTLMPRQYELRDFWDSLCFDSERGFSKTRSKPSATWRVALIRCSRRAMIDLLIPMLKNIYGESFWKEENRIRSGFWVLLLGGNEETAFRPELKGVKNLRADLEDLISTSHSMTMAHSKQEKWMFWTWELMIRMAPVVVRECCNIGRSKFGVFPLENLDNQVENLSLDLLRAKLSGIAKASDEISL